MTIDQTLERAVGRGIPRQDGRAKVTGAARYADDQPRPANMAYAVLVSATVAAGRVRNLDTRRAEAAPGVVAVYTHRDRLELFSPSLAYSPGPSPFVGPLDPLGNSGLQVFLPLQSDRLEYDGQYVAMVVAETFEAAQEAALLVTVEYDPAPPRLWDPAIAHREGVAKPVVKIFGILDASRRRGDPEAALAASPIKLDRTYVTQTMHHHPVEPHGTTAVWEGDLLTIHEPSQWILGTQRSAAEMLGIPRENVRVVSEFVGGAFGGKGTAGTHTALCAAAARRLRRPVRLQLARAQLSYGVGGRAATSSRVRLGSGRDGRVETLLIDSVGESPTFQDTIFEPPVVSPRHMYANPHMATTMGVVNVNVGPASPMRSPGVSSGMFVAESALNELAEELSLDPLEIRRRNHADRNLDNGLPFSSKSLLACYDRGAALFGWSRRDPRPRSMTRDGKLIGWGVANATYSAARATANARVRLHVDGSAEVATASHDLGTGTYTVLAQIAGDALGLPPERVRVVLGDTRLPIAPASVGAWTVASVGSAVQAAAAQVGKELTALAMGLPDGPFAKASPADLSFASGHVLTAREPVTRLSATEIMRAVGRAYVDGQAEARPGAERTTFAMYSFGAQFVEVEVDPITSWARVSRIVGVYGAGRIVNPLTARSQLVGGIVWGIGMAMGEEVMRDPRTGRHVNPDLGGYHLPV